MAQTFVTNPLTGRIIQVGGTTFNRLIFDAYDYINGELVRRESAPPIPPREYYYNILTGRRILACGRRYYELIHANWDIEEDYYLIPPWRSAETQAILLEAERRFIRQSNNAPASYEQIMNRHRDTLANLNITLCKNCLIPIKIEEGEYCNECVSR